MQPTISEKFLVDFTSWSFSRIWRVVKYIQLRLQQLKNVYFQALKEKDLGNEAYKKKDFAAAHLHYDKAIEIDPKNIMYYTNKSAVLFEEGKFDECIELCEKAVNVGRENRATFAQIAK